MAKRYNEVVKLIDADKVYSIEEAIALTRKTSNVKFDASVDAHFKLNIDTKQSDQKVRVLISLPHGTGKTLHVAAFVTPTKEQEARSAGADTVGGEELVKRIKETGKTDFDAAVAEPAMMKSLAVIAKILGQRGLMPNPKTGTVEKDVGRIIKELKGGKVEVKTDASGNIHQVIGKVSFDDQKLIANFRALKDAIYRAKPAAVKKDFVASITISTTMGTGIRVQK